VAAYLVIMIIEEPINIARLEPTGLASPR